MTSCAARRRTGGAERGRLRRHRRCVHRHRSKNGTRYTYLVQAADLAGNTATGSATVTPTADASTKHLLSPGAGSSLSRPPLLRWRKVARASYYNVQLFRNGRKILSAWPTRPQYQLRSRWRYRGERHRLVHGSYRWLLWAGYGHRSEHRYGRLLGRRTSSFADARHNAGVRCLYVDLDGTLLGAGGAVTRDGEGGFTLLGIRALEACHRAGALVCAMSGRPRTVLHDDARILGLDDYIFEAGGGFAVGDELHWLAEPDTHERITASGAPDLLLERYRGRLEPHTPYSEGREVSHILRGHIDVEEARALLHERGHDDLRLIDNGEAHHHSAALAGLPSVRLYHLLPVGVSKPAGVAPTCAHAA